MLDGNHSSIADHSQLKYVAGGSAKCVDGRGIGGSLELKRCDGLRRRRVPILLVSTNPFAVLLKKVILQGSFI